MSLVKMNVKKGDTVKILSGRDKDREGKIIESMPKKGKVVVEGVNKVTRHTKPNQKYPNGGRITKETPIAVCKVMLICPSCNKATRVGRKEMNGKHVRFCKKCGEVIDQTK